MTSEREAQITRAQAAFSSSLPATMTKVVLLGLFDAVMILAAMTTAAKEAWWLLAGIVVITAASTSSICRQIVYCRPSTWHPEWGSC